VHLIDAQGANAGTVDIRFAIRMAQDFGLDLVEMSNKEENIPLCKILDYGKFKYEQAKSKKPQAKILTKEIKMSSRIDKHDVDIKFKQVASWIAEGHRVEVSVQFKGRENSYKELGYAILDNFKNVPGAAVTGPKADGNRITLFLNKQGAL
jgi:translation initiation factor IF-3